MAYMALYRQWRPQSFDTLVGQKAVKKTLANALASGRIAHAYLFTGPRGTGKTSTARILAKALNCEHGPTENPCGHCVNCERITNGTSMDVFEIDAASNRGIEEIKALREQLAFAPVDGKYKIYIIDEVHMLTTEAFNALLKTLEEPPSHVVFILATTDPHKIPATIHSRCQRFDFRRVTVDEIAEHLTMVAEKSGIQADEEAIRLIAIQSEGGMRDALSLLDQCGVMGERVDVNTVREVLGIVGREALRDLILAIGENNVPLSLTKLHVLLENGKDVKQVLVELAEYLRALLIFKSAPSYSEIYLTDSEEGFKQCAESFGQARLLAAEERIHSAIQELKGTMRPKITAELCLLDLCRQEGSTLAALIARVEQLEKQIAQGVSVNSKPVIEAAKQVEVMEAPQPRAVATPKPIPVTPKPVEVKEAPKAPMVEIPKPYVAKAATVDNSQATGDVPTGEEYWKQALELLKNEKKNALYSCAKSGRVVSFTNGVLQVAYKMAFQCDRMNKDDYRSYVEDTLLRQTRMAIHLQCVVDDGKARPNQANFTKPSPSVEIKLPNINKQKVDGINEEGKLKKSTSTEVENSALTEGVNSQMRLIEKALGGKIQKL